MKHKFKILTRLLTVLSFVSAIQIKSFATSSEILVPNVLEAGDTIYILETSCTTEGRKKLMEERMGLVIENLKSQGFKVVVYEESFENTPLGLGDGAEQLRSDLFNKAVKGPEIGGNMCLIGCLIATPYEPSYKGKILFFEDIEENDYRIHRALWQLKLAGRLDEVSGIIIGKLTPVEG